MSASDETKTKLRELRNRLAFEPPRARMRPNTPKELAERLQAALDAVNGACAMPVASTESAAEAIEEARQEAIVDAHLVLHDWERWAETQRQPKLKAQPPKPRRANDARRSGMSRSSCFGTALRMATGASWPSPTRVLLARLGASLLRASSSRSRKTSCRNSASAACCSSPRTSTTAPLSKRVRPSCGAMSTVYR